MTMRARLAAAVLMLACSPYDPNLGPSPFLCGTDEPRCPDGYTAVDTSPIRCECQLDPVLPDAGGGYRCSADTLEPNDDVHAPTVTHVGQNSTDNFSNIAICPDGDVDAFGLTVPLAGTLLQATVMFDTTRTAPAIDFLDAAGVSLHPTVTPAPGQLVATLTAMQPGSYVIRLSKGETGGETVNYSLRIQIFLPQ
jgi:hypothetical protein